MKGAERRGVCDAMPTRLECRSFVAVLQRAAGCHSAGDYRSASNALCHAAADVSTREDDVTTSADAERDTLVARAAGALQSR